MGMTMPCPSARRITDRRERVPPSPVSVVAVGVVLEPANRVMPSVAGISRSAPSGSTHRGAVTPSARAVTRGATTKVISSTMESSAWICCSWSLS